MTDDEVDDIVRENWRLSGAPAWSTMHISPYERALVRAGIAAERERTVEAEDEDDCWYEYENE